MNNTRINELGLYIHIPFCVRKCAYCDFLSAPATDSAKAAYVDALLTEIKSYQGRNSDYIVPTIFFGGGTPSCLPAEAIARIMEEIQKVFWIDAAGLEATIEVNPGTVDKEKLLIYQKAGLNRLSFGLQSTDNKELKRLGRIHSFEEFCENFKLAREVGFTNINIDLMSALPGQTLASWEKTLNKVIAMKPEHISAYSLIIEEGTEFYDLYHPGSPYEKELPDEDTDRLIYHKTKEILEAAGYYRYEISNYAHMGYECRHNNSYWIGTEYLGLGLGASSLLKGVRTANCIDLKQYMASCSEHKASLADTTYKKNITSVSNPLLQDPNLQASGMQATNLQEPILLDSLGIREEYQQLSKKQQMEEFMFLGLRRCEGVKKSLFKERFSQDIDSVYGKILKDLEQKQLIELDSDWIRLTEQGIDISNRVLAEFLFDD